MRPQLARRFLAMFRNQLAGTRIQIQWWVHVQWYNTPAVEWRLEREVCLSVWLSDVQSSHLVQRIVIKQNPKWGNVYWLLHCCKNDYWVLVSIKWCDLNLQLKFICVLSNRVKYVCGLHSWKTSDLLCQCQTAYSIIDFFWISGAPGVDCQVNYLWTWTLPLWSVGVCSKNGMYDWSA